MDSQAGTVLISYIDRSRTTNDRFYALIAHTVTYAVSAQKKRRSAEVLSPRLSTLMDRETKYY